MAPRCLAHEIHVLGGGGENYESNFEKKGLSAFFFGCQKTMSACEKRDHWEQAMLLLWELHVISFNSATSLNAKGVQWDQALSLWSLRGAGSLALHLLVSKMSS